LRDRQPLDCSNTLFLITSAECEPEEATPYEKKVIAKTPETIQRIEAAVADNFLFSSLDAAQKKEIIDAMEERKVEKVGEVIIKQVREICCLAL
jgi:hypothetical protein